MHPVELIAARAILALHNDKKTVSTAMVRGRVKGQVPLPTITTLISQYKQDSAGFVSRINALLPNAVEEAKPNPSATKTPEQRLTELEQQHQALLANYQTLLTSQQALIERITALEAQ